MKNGSFGSRFRSLGGEARAFRRAPPLVEPGEVGLAKQRQALRRGELLHTVSAIYPLARTADAHAAVEYAPKKGTVVVSIRD